MGKAKLFYHTTTSLSSSSGGFPIDPRQGWEILTEAYCGMSEFSLRSTHFAAGTGWKDRSRHCFQIEFDASSL